VARHSFGQSQESNAEPWTHYPLLERQPPNPDCWWSLYGPTDLNCSSLMGSWVSTGRPGPNPQNKFIPWCRSNLPSYAHPKHRWHPVLYTQTADNAHDTPAKLNWREDGTHGQLHPFMQAVASVQNMCHGHNRACTRKAQRHPRMWHMY